MPLIPTTLVEQVAGVFDAYALIRDEKVSGTSSGTITAGTWTKRDLNTEVDPEGIVSISSSVFTLQNGTYLIIASAPAWSAAGNLRHKIRLRNTSDNTTVGVGSSAYLTSSGPSTESHLVARISITSAKNFEIQHWGDQTQATDGLGIADNAGEVEVYCQVSIWREPA